MKTVCETCGDEGFVEAFVYCDACKTGAVHRYCCGITPVPIDDYVIWFCSECEESDTGFECNEVDQVGILTPPVVKVEYHELQDSRNVKSVEVTSAPPVMETVEEPQRREVSGSVESNELTGLVGSEGYVTEAGDGASLIEKSGNEKKKKMKKRKRESIDHSLPDSPNVEPVEASKKRDESDTGKSDELTGLVSNEISVLEKSEKKKRNEGSSNHTSSVLEAEGHGLQDTTNVEATKQSEELNGLARNEVSVLEKREKKKKKKKTNKEEEKKNEESSNHSSPVLDAEDHGLQDASSAESMKDSKKRKTTDSRNSEELNGLASNEVSVLEKSEKKKKKKKMTNKEEEKKNEESSNHNSPVLDAEDHGLQDATSAEPMKESKKQKTTDTRNSDELNGLVKNEVSVLRKSEKNRKKKKDEESSNHTSHVLDAEDHGLQDATIAEPVNESKKRETTDSRNSDELNGIACNEVSVLEKSEKKKKKKKKKEKMNKKEEKKNEESCNHTSPVLDAEDHGLQDATSAEPMKESKKQKTSDTRNSDELNGLVKNEVSVLRKSEKNRKKKKKDEESSNHTSHFLDAEDHGLQDATIAEPVNESKKRETRDSRNSDELNGLACNEVFVLEKSEKKKKKKKKKEKMNKEEEKKNEESCNHTSPVLDAEDHGLQDTTCAEPMKESKKQKTSDSRNAEELKGLVRNEVSVLEKSEKKKKKKKNKEEEKKNGERSNHSSPVLDAEDHGLLQDATSAKPIKESKKQKTSDSRNSNELNSLVRNDVSVLEKSEKKKEMNKEEEESSNHTLPVLAVEDNGVQDTINVEPAKAQESSASVKPHELVGLAKYAASVSEGGNSSTVPDHSSCTPSTKRRLSSGNIRVTSENTELAAADSSCKETESNMPQRNGVLTATDSPVLNNDRALPIFKPIWRGSISVKQGSICSIDRLVAHLSSLACHKVHEKASSLQARLSAEMFPRLDIWPESFLKNGPPADESIALYFFPSRDSKDEKLYYSLVDEMKNDDMAMRCVLDTVELLIFTSYQLPMDCWKFHSKEYLWGIFRRRKTSRH